MNIKIEQKKAGEDLVNLIIVQNNLITYIVAVIFLVHYNLKN